MGPTVLTVISGSGARAPGLVPEDELVDGPAALPPVLLRPAEGEPAVPTHVAHRFAEGGPTELVPLVVEALPQVEVGEELGVVGAQLSAQRLLFGGEVDVHGEARGGSGAVGRLPGSGGGGTGNETCSSSGRMPEGPVLVH